MFGSRHFTLKKGLQKIILCYQATVVTHQFLSLNDLASCLGFSPPPFCFNIYQHGNSFRTRLVFRAQHANQEKTALRDQVTKMVAETCRRFKWSKKC